MSASRSLLTIITQDSNWLDSFMCVGTIVAYTIGYIIHNIRQIIYINNIFNMPYNKYDTI